MNATLSALKFYIPLPPPASQPKRSVNRTRKELLDLAVTATDSGPFHEQDSSKSVTIHLDTPILRSQPARQIVSMTSKGPTVPCRFFPAPKPPSGRKSGQQVPDTSLPHGLRRMSIAQKKMERSIAFVQATVRSVSGLDKLPSSSFKTETKISLETVPDRRVEQKMLKLMKIALAFLKEYAGTIKAFLMRRLAPGAKGSSPVFLTARPPLPKQASFKKVGENPSSSASTIANSPELEGKRGKETAHVAAKQEEEKNVARAMEQVQSQNRSRREKKRRYTTPAEYPPDYFPKTTFDAIEKLAFEPVIK